MKSSHATKHDCTATSAMTGNTSGKVMRNIRCRTFAPSMTAASSISLGRLRINCIIRKIFRNPPPKNAGTVIGRSVFVQPISTNILYTGIIVRMLGSMIVPMATVKMIFLPSNFTFVNAYAANPAVSGCPITLARITISVLPKYFKKSLSIACAYDPQFHSPEGNNPAPIRRLSAVVKKLRKNMTMSGNRKNAEISTKKK